jgi:hypothetical protein
MISSSTPLDRPVLDHPVLDHSVLDHPVSAAFVCGRFGPPHPPLNHPAPP